MKKITFVMLTFVLLPSLLYAETWCRWSGDQGINCQDVSNKFIRMPDGHPIAVDIASLNDHGFYPLVVTEPVIGANQIKESAVWGFTGTEITVTWSIRDLTTTEINERNAQIMPLSEYYLWRALYVKGVITLTDIQNALSQELRDAYLARDALENP